MPENLRLLRNIDLPLARQVALDAALLDAVHQGRSAPCWRFYEPGELGVVLGTGMKVARDLALDRVRADGLPIIRRFSGGGTVVQGPGMLNYTAILPLAKDDMDVRRGYLRVLKVIQDVLADEGLRADFHPPCDLAVGERKIAGNAQARRRGAMLVHGSLLVDVDIDLFARYLRHPDDEPAYRRKRDHRSFVTTLRELGSSITPLELAECISTKLGFTPDQAQEPVAHECATAEVLYLEKFAVDDWNLRR